MSLLNFRTVCGAACLIGGAFMFGWNACIALPTILVGMLFIMSAAVATPSTQFVMPRMPQIFTPFRPWNPGKEAEEHLRTEKRAREEMRKTDERLLKSRGRSRR